MVIRVLIAIVFITLSFSFPSMSEESLPFEEQPYLNTIDFTPMSPLMNIYAFHYCRRITPISELLVGPSYMRIPYEGVGHTDAIGLILGYRQFFWKNLHVDYQLMPMYDRFYEENEQKRYYGFDLWNEFRLGYIFDFNLFNLPCFVNVQWPFGFILYSDPDGKPESFHKYKEEHSKFFYFPPMFFLGVRF
jgi:hypothetical protein